MIKFRFINATFWHLLILLIVATLAYWQISTFTNPLSYDQTSAFFPWRYFIGQSIKQGIFPTWNPYQCCGYPINCDPQSGLWYPIVWLFSFGNGYTIYAHQLEFMLHIYLAGVGMYFLAKDCAFTLQAALIAGISYMFCGVFVGNAQHFVWIIAAVWLPYILLFYIRLCKQQRIIDAIYTSFFLFMMITGGYPMFYISTAYLLLIFFTIFAVKQYRKEKWKGLWCWFKLNIVFSIITLLLSAGFLCSMYVAYPYFSRANGISLLACLEGPFAPQSIISFLLPYLTLKNPDFFQADMSMTNGYFGLITFCFFILGLFIKKPFELKIIFWFGVIFLLLAFGSYTPIREWFYHHIPLFNVSRFPALFRLFALFAFILTSGWNITLFQQQKTIFSKHIIIFIASLIIILVGLVILFYLKENNLFDNISTQFLFHFDDKSTWQEHGFVQSLWQLFILLIILFLTYKFKNPTKLIQCLIPVLIIDMVIATQLNAPYNIYSPATKTSELVTFCNKLPSGFPLPINKTVAENNDNIGSYQCLWQNMGNLYKKPVWNGFSSSFFQGFQPLNDSCPDFFNQLIQHNNTAFLSSSVLFMKNNFTFCKSINTNSQTLYLPVENNKQLPISDYKHSPKDTTIFTSFNPSKIKLKVISADKQMLCLMQNYYPGWHAFINNTETKIYKTNTFAMSIEIPKGEHEITFQYKHSLINSGFYISISTLIIFIVLFLLFKIKTIHLFYNNNNKN